MERTIERISMIKAVSFTLLAGGIMFLILGINASDAFSSDVSRLFTGAATDKALWMLGGGVVGITAGLAGLWKVSLKT
jgi:hypothetical protein